MKIKFTRYHAAEFLDSDEKIQAYLNVALEDNGDDPALIAKALGNVVAARGVAQVAKQAGLTRTSLYRTLSGDVKPDFHTILKIIEVLGMRLSIEPLKPKRTAVKKSAARLKAA